jgi:AmmeMemoRadiSam system protein A
MTGFRFALSEEEKTYLKDLAHRAIRQKLEPEKGHCLPEPPTPVLSEKLGAFVTLKIGRRLRGCIGHVVGDKPLSETVAQMAAAAAFHDSRFPPLTRGELLRVELDISILSPLAPCPDPEQVEVGRHGLLVRRGGRSGLLLPQVAVEWKWDRRTFLDQTCFKAGLPAGSWQEDGTELWWFEAVVF